VVRERQRGVKAVLPMLNGTKYLFVGDVTGAACPFHSLELLPKLLRLTQFHRTVILKTLEVVDRKVCAADSLKGIFGEP
jgi:hypothetical protein